jgi:hypothetical protein
MSGNIYNGESNKVPMSRVVKLCCGGTIAKGAPIGFSDSAAVAALVVTYGTGSFTDGTTIAAADLDAADPSIGAGAFGVAKEGGTVGQWIDVVVGGYCDYVVTDQSVEEGDILIPTAAAGVCEGTAGETGSILGFGVALVDDTAAVLTKAMIFNKFGY